MGGPWFGLEKVVEHYHEDYKFQSTKMTQDLGLKKIGAGNRHAGKWKSIHFLAHANDFYDFLSEICTWECGI